MKLTTREWVAKAEGDFGMMEREARRRKNVCYDGIGFHAQQCAEKYLKARLCTGVSCGGRTVLDGVCFPFGMCLGLLRPPLIQGGSSPAGRAFAE